MKVYCFYNLKKGQTVYMSKPSTLKICTWNVNGIRACYEKNLPQFIQDVKPDILCLQETKAHIGQVEPHIQGLGYDQHLWSSAYRKGYSGVATFSNDPIFDERSGIDKPEYDNEGRIVWTRHQHFDLYNIYFPNGASGPERHQYKQNFLKDLSRHLSFELKRGRDIIVVGDYNIAHKNIDVYSPSGLATESGFLPEERQWFDEFINLGFTDAYRVIHGDKKNQYSWWSYKDQARLKNNGWRIDYICVSAGLVDKIKSCEILMEQQGSDHCPVVVEMEF
jgi:exodeoxyribonuclease III